LLHSSQRPSSEAETFGILNVEAAMFDIQDWTLTRNMKNELFGVVLEHGFQPTEFNWSAKEDYTEVVRPFRCSILEHVSSKFFIRFEPDQTVLSPGADHHTAIASMGLKHGRELVREFLGQWLRLLRTELDAPDFWEQAKSLQEMIRAASSTKIPNDPFTPEELKVVAARLVDLEKFVKKGRRLKAHEIRQLTEQMAYLAETSERLGRKDWLNLLFSVIVSIAVSGIFAPERAHELWTYALALIHPLFQQLGQLPPPRYYSGLS
jgi:hypothetical protein